MKDKKTLAKNDKNRFSLRWYRTRKHRWNYWLPTIKVWVVYVNMCCQKKFTKREKSMRPCYWLSKKGEPSLLVVKKGCALAIGCQKRVNPRYWLSKKDAPLLLVDRKECVLAIGCQKKVAPLLLVVRK